jgi:hypothetical protein
MIGRRQFVGATAFAFAGLVPATRATQAQSQSSDPVLDSIIADFQQLRREGDEKPGQRRGAVRAAEALTGILAAHLAQRYDPAMKRTIRQQLRAKGRQALVQELTTRANKPDITHERVDAMLTRFEQDGMGGVLRDVQKGLKRMRENMPDYAQVRAVKAEAFVTTQYDFCQDLNWMIQMTEMMAALACGIAQGFAGLNPEADAACAGLTVTLAMYLAMKWWYNC